MKKGLIIVFVIIIGLAIAVPISNNYVENKITTALENLPEHIRVKIDDISVNVLFGSVSLNTIDLTVLGNTTKEANLEIKLKAVLVKSLSYSDFLFDKEIVINQLELNQPQITMYRNDVVEKKEHMTKDSVSKKQLIQIGAFKINEGSLSLINKSNDSLFLKANSFSISLNDVSNTVYKKYNTPISFSDFDFLAESVFVSAGKYENLQLGSIHINSNSATLKSLKFKTKYSRFELSRRITSERDHINLEIDSIVMDNLNLGFKTDSIFNFEVKSTSIYKPKFINFRDKLVADNYKIKSMYGKSLRELNFNLNLESIHIKNGEVVYEEKVNHNIIPGKIMFTEFNSEMKNVSNTYKAGEKKTSINMKALFMGDAPINNIWEFDVKDINDSFIFKSKLGSFNIQKMNQFMEPNLNINIQGTLHKTFFTIDGNSNISSVNFKTNFDDFKINVFRKNVHKKNKVLSAVANLVVSKSSKKGEDHYIDGKRTGIVRDKTKSVFNFIWLNVKAGLIHLKH